MAVLDLPKTFQDAICITRHLGIRFLWIDCMCIFQDNPEDWAYESARMTNLYSNAHVIIAAGRAKNSSEGCFHVRESRTTSAAYLPDIGRVTLRKLIPIDSANIRMEEFPDEPLSQRTRALQERVLGRRIVHYNKRQMYFECNHGLGSEGGCGSEERYCDYLHMQRCF